MICNIRLRDQTNKSHLLETLNHPVMHDHTISWYLHLQSKGEKNQPTLKVSRNWLSEQQMYKLRSSGRTEKKEVNPKPQLQ